jgi:hypothetical protein
MKQPYIFDELITAPSPRWMEHCQSLSLSSSERRLRGVYLSVPSSIVCERVADASELSVAAPVELTGPLPSITKLSLVANGWMDESSARGLPNLVALRLENRRPVELSWFAAPNLKSIALRERAILNPRSLATLPVEQVRVEWQALPFETLPRDVVGLVVNAWKTISPEELGKVAGLRRLKALTISGAAVLSDLGPLATARTLTDVAVSTRSLVGVSDLDGLTGLRLSGKIPALTELSGAQQLERLALFLGSSGEAVLSTLPPLKTLRRLEIDGLSINGFTKISSLAFLTCVAAIEELVLTGMSIEDADMMPIRELKHLRHVEILGSLDPQVEELIRAKQVELADIRNIAATGDAHDELAASRVGAEWGVFGDLRARLGVENNYDAERLLRGVLAAEAPELLSRVSFDTEAGLFSVTANDRADIDSIISILRRASILSE